ncbi:glycosyltransferase [Candidatus Accumulibacter phosphatis]|uniref:Glycosyltransferase n=1 Tax=Candidatus Accumulibacter phosphatis TaxID=327160 RepID=A0ABX1TW17_9PROT|nr:glycosyltransferase [Candidatus Accumulibacter phosphatis]
MCRSVGTIFGELMDDLLHRLSDLCPSRVALSSGYRMPGRLLYAVNHSFPFSSNGYAVRTHGIARALVREGVSVIAATRPGVPWDQPGFGSSDYASSHRVEGVRYVHSRRPSRHGLPPAMYLARAVDSVSELLRVFKPSAVLAASNWENALPVALAARTLGLPFFYEVRGFWEISRVSREPDWENTSEYRQVVERETAVAQAAERVFTINRFMRDELVRRGVARDQVDLVPNGFSDFPARSRPAPLGKGDVGITTRFVVGYVGSFNVYEGLEDLIEATAVVRRRGVDVSLLLVGSSASMGVGADAVRECSASVAYRALAQRLGITEFVFLPGRVGPDEASDYYALLDLVVIPRRPFAVCEMVSPVKPLEAVARGKRVLMSNVAPLADLAELSQNFTYFEKGQVDSLAEKLVEVLFATACATSLPECGALEMLSWERNVAPIAAALASVPQGLRRAASALR